MRKFDFLDLAGSRQISLNYDVDDFDDDLNNRRTN